MDVLEVRGLEKVYGRRKVVGGGQLRVGEAEIVGLLGPNGAGKSTSFRMTCGIIKPDARPGSLGRYRCYRLGPCTAVRVKVAWGTWRARVERLSQADRRTKHIGCARVVGHALSPTQGSYRSTSRGVRHYAYPQESSICGSRVASVVGWRLHVAWYRIADHHVGRTVCGH